MLTHGMVRDFGTLDGSMTEATDRCFGLVKGCRQSLTRFGYFFAGDIGCGGHQRAGLIGQGILFGTG